MSERKYIRCRVRGKKRAMVVEREKRANTMKLVVNFTVGEKRRAAACARSGYSGVDAYGRSTISGCDRSHSRPPRDRAGKTEVWVCVGAMENERLDGEGREREHGARLASGSRGRALEKHDDLSRRARNADTGGKGEEYRGFFLCGNRRVAERYIRTLSHPKTAGREAVKKKKYGATKPPSRAGCFFIYLVRVWWRQMARVSQTGYV